MKPDRFERRPGRALNLEPLRKLFEDERLSVIAKIGVVYKPDGENHFDNDSDIGMLVDVKLMPGGEPLLCRLGAAAGGQGIGVWRVPKPGTEVLVLVPGGELQGGGVIVSTLSTGAAPSLLDEDILLLVGDKLVHLESTGDKLVLKSHGDTMIDSDGDVVIQGGSEGAARVDDDVDGGKLAFLFGAGTGGASLDIQHVAPGGVTPPGYTAVSWPGKISSGSTKTKIG
jgi:hypothetical protein